MDVTDVTDFLIEILEKEGIPAMQQGSIAAEENYPPCFYTFWNSETEENYYDNKCKIKKHEFEVNFYSQKPEEIAGELGKTKQNLRDNNFIITEPEHDVYSDEATHRGRGITVVYIELE